MGGCDSPEGWDLRQRLLPPPTRTHHYVRGGRSSVLWGQQCRKGAKPGSTERALPHPCARGKSAQVTGASVNGQRSSGRRRGTVNALPWCRCFCRVAPWCGVVPWGGRGNARVGMTPRRSRAWPLAAWLWSGCVRVRTAAAASTMGTLHSCADNARREAPGVWAWRRPQASSHASATVPKTKVSRPGLCRAGRCPFQTGAGSWDELRGSRERKQSESRC